jgi:hypothetical protein
MHWRRGPETSCGGFQVDPGPALWPGAHGSAGSVMTQSGSLVRPAGRRGGQPMKRP